MAVSYNVEPVLEDALAAILAQSGISAQTSRGIEEVATPRAEVRFELGGERDAMSPGNPQTSYLWDGQLVVSVVTDRDRNNASHSEFRAAIRRTIAETVAADWEAQLAGAFRLLSLTHTATAYNLSDEKAGLDASVMSYAAVLEFLDT